MAKPPDWIDKVNYIVDFWIDPCHAPVLVYLELALEPAGEALLTWFSFGLQDVLRGWLRPARALGGTTTRRGKRKSKHITKWQRAAGLARAGWRRTPGLGEDVGGWIGKQLPGAQELRGRSIHQATRYLWLVDDVAQRALFWLMVTDVVIDFGYEWATALNESEFCKRQKSGSLYATGPGTGAGGIIICNVIGADNVIWADGPVGWNNSVGSVGPGGWTCVSGITVRNVSPSPVTHSQRALISDQQGTRTEIRGTHTLQPGEEGTSVANFHIAGPGGITVNHCASGGVVTNVSADVTLFGGP